MDLSIYHSFQHSIMSAPIQEELRDLVSNERDKEYVRIVQRITCSEQYCGRISQQDIIRAIQYLNNLPGGIERHREGAKLFGAVQHLLLMRDKGRLNVNGMPVEYSMEELQQILVEGIGYPVEDVRRIVEECVEKRGFHPSPEEFEEVHSTMKVKLENEISAKDTQLQENAEEIRRKDIQLDEKNQIIQDKDRMLGEQEREKTRLLEEQEREIIRLLEKKGREKNRLLDEKEREKNRLLDERDREKNRLLEEKEREK
ncbi:zinc finger CCCH domain-containing protein 13-like isoform X2 [Ostrea edulis]|uniref:zinc finger CCCH domain-containing protein 13-like isoform X2 n=1 Tax=Ostrea edulis TaxID=37623 RepID=UPI0024AF49A5|nr:zinc finger CCCH domain-containing protein 13-like isoform X2 [Ostrea edulis]